MGLHVVGVPVHSSLASCGSVYSALDTGCAAGAIMQASMAWSMSLRGRMDPIPVNGQFHCENKTSSF